ncbi:hypothetical protein [Hymenobacter jejuensis]|uniref:Uncharacterized protein n=1 Tax=Hymenobacter jejuensis TaxID=2502781 RepID=A0A5B7ZVN4_9BACT|nr:hypothetical protein [Hymenobacter jejuensis]QDA59161.1 hypothetical protein FHG12_03150 [Hymenobacter jejuensis]
MLKNFTYFLTGSTLLMATGCAGSYAPIRPNRIASYQSVTSQNAPISFGYQYSALATGGHNKKYVKRERKRGYQVVAVRVTNNTASELNFSRDTELYFGDRPVQPVPSLQASLDLKQGVWIYLLYLMANVNVGGTYNANTGQTTGATFLPTGFAIAGGNILGASAANKNLQREFTSFDLTNRFIKPGETVYGIVSLREAGLSPLHLVLRNNAVTVQPTPTAAPATPSVPAAAPEAAPASPTQPAPASSGSGR